MAIDRSGGLRTSVGLGSGLPIADIVKQSVESEFNYKRDQINDRELKAQAKITSLGKLQSSLDEFETQLREMSSSSKMQTKTANVINDPTSNSNTRYLDAVAAENAAIGEYKIVVDRLAAYDKYMANITFTSENQIIGTGTLNFEIGDPLSQVKKNFSLEIDSGNENNTLSGVCREINRITDQTGIAATILQANNEYRLVLSAQNPGVKNSFRITVDDDDNNDSNNVGLSTLATSNMDRKVTAVDAKIHIDDIEINLDQNKATDVISGITLDLLTADVGKEHTLSITNDSNDAKGKILKFVEKYNNIIDLVNKFTKHKKDAINVYDETSSTDETVDGKSKDDNKTKNKDIDPKTGNGIFLGDATIRRLTNTLSSSLISVVGGNGPTSLLELGIKSDFKTGKLTVDEKKLDTELKTGLKNVSNIMGHATDGVANKMLEELKVFTATGGILKTQSLDLVTGLQNTVIERMKLEEKSAERENYLTLLYAKLDKAIAASQSQQNTIAQSLMGLNNNK